MNTTRRTIGLDVHPDLFTAALLLGQDAATAKVTRLWDKRPIAELDSWAKKHALPSDDLVIEASGNTFAVAERLKKLGFKVVVLESFQTSRIQNTYCVNDKISAAQIGRAWLSGLAKVVWQPDARTRIRREVFSAHRKAVKRTTQMRARIRAFLNQHGIRIKHSISPRSDKEIVACAPWSALQERILRSYFEDLTHAEQKRKEWHSVIAREVVSDCRLLQLTRLLGIGDLTAFALGAVIGDIGRFSGPKKLVAYAGLNPSLKQSGNSSAKGGLGGHGRGDLRSILVQGAQAILRSRSHALSRWGHKILLRRGLKVAIIAVARKLLVAVWYCLNGKYRALQEVEPDLRFKLLRIIRATPWQEALTPGESERLWNFVKKRLLAFGRAACSGGEQGL